MLSDGPLPLPTDWSERVNAVQTEAEILALRRSVQRGVPYGDKSWQERTATALGQQSVLGKFRPPDIPLESLRFSWILFKDSAKIISGFGELFCLGVRL